MTVYERGVSLGVGGVVPTGTKRGESRGWTRGACSRCKRFLMSADPDGLTGVGVALTLTLRDRPATSDEWQKLCQAYLERLRRLGRVRGFWLVEWQRRGVPHLHLAFWWPEGTAAEPLCEDLVRHWCEAAARWGPEPFAQTAKPMHNDRGWAEYVTKHSARGVAHYQRQLPDLGEGWERTGRMWGHVGDWPTCEPLKLDPSIDGLIEVRRRLLEREAARAEAAGNAEHLEAVRAELERPPVGPKGFRGISQFGDRDEVLAVVAEVEAMGHRFPEAPPPLARAPLAGGPLPAARPTGGAGPSSADAVAEPDPVVAADARAADEVRRARRCLRLVDGEPVPGSDREVADEAVALARSTLAYAERRRGALPVGSERSLWASVESVRRRLLDDALAYAQGVDADEERAEWRAAARGVRTIGARSVTGRAAVPVLHG